MGPFDQGFKLRLPTVNFIADRYKLTRNSLMAFSGNYMYMLYVQKISLIYKKREGLCVNLNFTEIS